MKTFLLFFLCFSLHAQTLVSITGTNFRDAAGHKLSGTCTPTPVGVTAPPWFVGPVSIPFSLSNGAYTTAMLPGNYAVGCGLNYGKQTVSITMNWLVAVGGPYRIDQVVVTSPTGQQYSVLAQQLATGGVNGQVLTFDDTKATSSKWATQTGGAGGVTWGGTPVTWGN